MILEAIAGFIAGLIGGPAIIFLASVAIYMLRANKVEGKIDNLQQDHADYIKDVKNKYKKLHKKYMKVREKVIRLAGNIKEDSTINEA